MLRPWLTAGLMLMLAGSVEAQIVGDRPSQLEPSSAPTYPGTETSPGLSLHRIPLPVVGSDLRSDMGFYVDVTNNVNRWVGVSVEGSGHFFRESLFGVDILSADLYTVQLGPKFTYRGGVPVEPFGRFLVGASYGRAEILGSFQFDGWNFMLQPGGGVDIVLGQPFAIRLAVDVPVFFESGSNTDSVRFTVGATFRGGPNR